MKPGIALLVSTVAAAAAEPADPLSQWLASLDRGNWTARALAADAVLLVRPAAPDGRFQRLWARYELLNPETTERGFAYLSRVSLSEFDCNARSGRTLETTWYAGNNMQVPSQQSDLVTPWLQPEPGTLFDEELKLACRGQ